MMKGVVLFGGSGPEEFGSLRLIHRRERATIEKAAKKGVLKALVLDARTGQDFASAKDLLRVLFDNPRRPQRMLHPGRIVALVASGDAQAAFALGRFGIAGVLEAHELSRLGPQLDRVLASEDCPSVLDPPACGIELKRAALLTARPEGELPTVTLGYRHAPETLAGLEYYCLKLREHGADSTVFEDVATLIEVMVREGLTCQTNLATKAGTTHTGQFIGSFEYYRELRRTRYAEIPDHPSGLIEMDVFVAIDEILHEVLHLLFLANRLRAGIEAQHPRVAEELSLSWWQGVVHNRVFPQWICDHHILEINYDFSLAESRQEAWEFWTIGNVFDPYAHFSWITYVIAKLPVRGSYMGQRADLGPFLDALAGNPDAVFLISRSAELEIKSPFNAYPVVPETLRVCPR